MAMGVRATLTGGALVEADRGCRRPYAGAVCAAEVGTFTPVLHDLRLYTNPTLKWAIVYKELTQKILVHEY